MILNKDAAKDLDAVLEFGRVRDRAVQEQWLRADALDSRDARIASASAAPATTDGRHHVVVPHASAVCVRLG